MSEPRETTEVRRSKGGANLTAIMSWEPDINSRRGGWWKIVRFEDDAVQKAAEYRVQGSGYASSIRGAWRTVHRIQRQMGRGIDRVLDGGS